MKENLGKGWWRMEKVGEERDLFQRVAQIGFDISKN